MSDAELPVDSLRDAVPFLRRPFTPSAVKFKVQATNKANTAALVVAYIDARLCAERLNAVVPHLWHDEYRQVDGGLLCRLTVDGVTRIDMGDGIGKAGFSDALKRAAVKFGVGVSLYAIPQQWANVDRGAARPIKGNTSLELTDQGNAAMRQQYERWLADAGVKGFGEPLDHGDRDTFEAAA